MIGARHDTMDPETYMNGLIRFIKAVDAGLMLQEKAVEALEQHRVQDGPLRMSRTNGTLEQ